jgi:prepilin-type N-terminal cleavage/methylation domain-containing protein
MRRGVTLVELLVVIMIMLMITAIAIPVIAPALKNRDVREAARMVDVYFNGARTRAMNANHPYGVMIERIPGQPNGSVTLSYCEQPDPYTGDFANAASFPGMPSTAGSAIRMLGNGGFGAWVGPLTPAGGGYATQPTSAGPPGNSNDPLFPMGDLGWVQSTLPGGAGLLTNFAPGDTITVNGTAFRLWAGEPFIDVNQNGFWDQGEPFADVDGSSQISAAAAYTPPNPAYIDPASGYFIQPTVNSTSPFPTISWGTQSAFITYMYADPVVADQTMNSTGLHYGGIGDPLNGTPIFFGPGGTWTPLSGTAFPYSITQWTVGGMPPMPVQVPNAAKSWKFSFARRPVKTSAPSLQLPGQAVIDLGANYPDQQFSIVVPVPGSGMEVLVQQQNATGWWSTFRANPALDPTVPGSLAQLGTGSADPTSIMITFQPNGVVDKVYSWSEAHNTNTTMTVINWTDWQGRIPASPIYLLIGRQDLINGDPTLVPLIPQNVAPLKPIYNVQDPNALWVVINPQTGAVATAENVGFDLTTPIPPNANVTGQNALKMQVYWAANVYYSRRLARSMLDMGGR